MSEKTFKISAEKTPSGVLLRTDFGRSAQNDEIVRDAVELLKGLNLSGGSTVLVNGRASLPVAMAIGHYVAHLFKEVAVYDPKMEGYIVAISHGGREVGTLIPA